MYGNCTFCSARLGVNDALEQFPVGRQIAFDGWKGRLWVVCPACARWNLSPIEERWEAVEAAEKLFRDARLRVQSENVGLAQLPDGTRLVRVGTVVPGELAAWRYGRQLRRRRRRYFVAGAASLVATGAVYGGLAAMGLGLFSFALGTSFVEERRNQKVLHRVRLPEPPARLIQRTRGQILIRRWHIDRMSLHLADDGEELEVRVRDAHRRKPSGISPFGERLSADVAEFTGDEARALLRRVMVHVNKAGASRSALDDANRVLATAGSAEAVVRATASRRAVLGQGAGPRLRQLRGARSLAFEMALNEESERRALKGELAALEAAWREAEEIAAIADTLPGEAALNRLLERLKR